MGKYVYKRPRSGSVWMWDGVQGGYFNSDGPASDSAYRPTNHTVQGWKTLTRAQAEKIASLPAEKQTPRKSKPSPGNAVLTVLKTEFDRGFTAGQNAGYAQAVALLQSKLKKP